jgi:hypothetical protein
MTALSRRQTLVGAAAGVAADVLPAVAAARSGFIETIGNDGMEDGIGDAWALHHGGPDHRSRPNVQRSPAPARIQGALAGRSRDRFMTVFARRQTLPGITGTGAVLPLPAVAEDAPASRR